MKLVSRKTTWGALGVLVLCCASLGSATGQTATARKPVAARKTPAAKKPAALPVGTALKPLMAAQAFSNVRVLKGISAVELMDTMGFFSASLRETCTYCHTLESSGSWPHYADDTPLKQTTRKMILLVNAINKTNFEGRRVVTCYSCHGGEEVPKIIPELSAQYAAPENFEPDEIVKQNPNAPLPDQILDKYIEAIGGGQRVAQLTSFVARGAYEAYSASQRGTAELYAKAPNQRATFIHTDSGDFTTVFNGRTAWVAGPEDSTPLPVVALSGSDLDGVKLDALLSFPSQIKKSFTKWRTGAPISIDGRKVQVIQGASPSGSPVKLYFDAQTGLLVREVRFIQTIVGRNPFEVDYSDYRDVSGIKMPFHMVVMWTDGRSKYNFTQYEINVPIDAAKFAQPPAPKPLLTKN